MLLSLAGAAILMGFITAEALYPGVFTTHTNTVSHLGASEPPNSVVLQPSAAIFDITMLVTGAMILAGAWFAYRALRRKAVLVPTALLGVGTLGVGVFPLTHPAPHTLFALHRLPGRRHRRRPVVPRHHGPVPLPLDGAWSVALAATVALDCSSWSGRRWPSSARAGSSGGSCTRSSCGWWPSAAT